MNYLYIIRCEDGSLYTGITKDLPRRMKEHAEGKKRAARYTRSRRAVELSMAWSVSTWKETCRLEYFIKTLTKKQKEQLLLEPGCLGQMFVQKKGGELPVYEEYRQIQKYPVFLQDFLLNSTDLC